MSRTNSATGNVTANGPRNAFNSRIDVLRNEISTSSKDSIVTCHQIKLEYNASNILFKYDFCSFRNGNINHLFYGL